MSASLLPVSIVIITHRVDQKLTEVLGSVEWAAEKILIDNTRSTQSRNKTELQKIAQEFQAKVIPHDQEITDFSQVRNDTKKYVSQPWIFYVDSDEVVSANAASVLTELCKKDTQGISVKRIDVFHGRELHHGEVADVWLTRIARTSAIQYKRPVHEVAEIEGQVTRSPLILSHFAHPTLSAFLTSVSRYAYLEAQSRHAQGIKFTWWRSLFFPTGKGLVNYVFKLGFLDGMPGVVYALMMSLHSLMVSIFLYEMEH